jgi:hypothetical protein
MSYLIKAITILLFPIVAVILPRPAVSPTLPPSQIKYIATSTSKNIKNVEKIIPAKSVEKPQISQMTQATTASFSNNRNYPDGVAQSLPIANFESINQSIRSAIINILCTESGTDGISYVTGSGVMISPNGIILTNAHIAQFWLLKNFSADKKISCVIRTGSPAYPAYLAEVLYISPRWIENNTTLLKSSKMKGTGENDFALLYITGQAGNNVTLPRQFSFVNPDIIHDFSKNEPVLLASYPAKLVGGEIVLRNLYAASAITTVKQVYTFKEASSDAPIDVISVGGTVVSQTGSSGGAVIDENRNLIGIISTESDNLATSTSGLDLYAITLGHVDRSLREETGGGLTSLLQMAAENASTTSVSFMSSIGNNLSKILIDALTKK